MSDDLVKRLRAPVWAALPVEFNDLAADADEAADEIERLAKGWQEARIAASFSEDRAIAGEQRAEAAEAAILRHQREWEASVTEVARLREVLKKIEGYGGTGGMIARKALARAREARG